MLIKAREHLQKEGMKGGGVFVEKHSYRKRERLGVEMTKIYDINA